MVTYFCPQCWAELGDGVDHCPECGADIRALDQRPFVEKLMAALWSPEPLTPRRAAEILGSLADRAAVVELRRRYRANADPYLARDIAVALGQIGGAEAEAVLKEIAQEESVIPRTAALAEIERLERRRRQD